METVRKDDGDIGYDIVLGHFAPDDTWLNDD
jgi:hypothetical protein